ncbi:MAG: ATP-binding protein [Cyanobacteria bacterium CRU_2_1]|nr:ATP-binding protein [Cyanobacteria bacterium RU_5_0]NJR59552.1 ATP-binding protein [Cyanobacteria bacterium CRU_2_1]
MSTNGSPELPYRAHLQLNTDLNLLAQVLAWFEQFNQPPVPYSVWLECQLALAEGFTNAVRHAHEDQPTDAPIEIEVTVQRQAIEIRIWDVGAEFDLEQRLSNTPPIEDEAVHGRGLDIIKKIATTLSYSHIGQRNCLLIIKNYE